LRTEPVKRSHGRGRTALALLALALFGLGVAGCRQDMHDAPRYEPLERSEFFADGRASRDPVPGTVGRARIDEPFFEDPIFMTGLGPDGQPVATLAVELSPALLARGRERFNIFCAPCHDQTGRGEGMIVRRGYKRPQTFHGDRLREIPVGYFVDVMTRGFGQMPSYASQVRAADRWAIAAYIRALQLAQNARLADLPAVDREALGNLPAAGEAGAENGGAGAGAHHGDGPTDGPTGSTADDQGGHG